MTPALLAMVACVSTGHWEDAFEVCDIGGRLPVFSSPEDPEVPDSAACMQLIASQLGVRDEDAAELSLLAEADDSSVQGVVSAAWLLQAADFGTVVDVLGDQRIPAPLAARLGQFVERREDSGEDPAGPAIYDHIMDGIASVVVGDGHFPEYLSWPANQLHVPAIVAAHEVSWDVGALIHEAGHARGQYHIDCDTGGYNGGGKDDTWDGSMGEAAFLLTRLAERTDSNTWRGRLEMERGSYLRGLCPDVDAPI